MARPSFYKKRTSNFKKNTLKYKNKFRRFFATSYKQEKPYISFDKRVQRVISKNLENKCSISRNTNDSILKWPSGQTNPGWNVVRLGTDFFDISCGNKQNERIGNSIKLRKFIVKGVLHPNMEVNVTDTTDQWLRYSLQGYATVMLLRKTDGNTVQSTLTKLYEDGANYIDPTGNYVDHLLRFNDSTYKVYWKRRFKLGPSSSYEGTGGQNRVVNNNEFKLTADFYIDITKYIGKGLTIRYEDSLQPSMIPANLRTLCLAVVWSPPFGVMAANGTSTQTQSKSYYNMTTSAYYEYEDA